MEKNEILSKFDETRKSIVTSIREEYEECKGTDNPVTVGLPLFAYFRLQLELNEKLKDEDNRLSAEDHDKLCEIAIRITHRMEYVKQDFDAMLEGLDNEERKPDFFGDFVWPIISQFDMDIQDEGKDEADYVNLNDNNIVEYLSGLVSMCAHVAYDEVDYHRMMAVLDGDDLDSFTYECHSPQQTYDWVREEWGIPSTDPAHFFTRMEEMDFSENSEVKAHAMDALKEMREMMKKAMPMLCGTTLSGCKTDDEQEQFRQLLTSMINDEQYSEGMGNMYIGGMIFLAMMPEGSDITQNMHTHDGCVEVFDKWYGLMAGKAVKDFYEPLNDEQKNVARTCMLGGLLTAYTGQEISGGEGGFMGIRTGAAYNLPKDLNNLK